MQRPEYRSGRIDRAVKTYTVCDESRYLIIRNVPALGCADELVKLLGLYGEVEEYRMLDEEDCEPFTDVYWIKYARYNNSRFAKRKLDNFKFLGNLLDVAYAPNEETLSDTKNKLEERRRAVLNKIHANFGPGLNSPPAEPPQLKDPLLQSPSESQQYPPFVPQLLPRNARQQTPLLTTNLQEPQRSTSSRHKEHFPLASMNATVHAIRDKLNKIEASLKLEIAFHQISEVGLVASTTEPQIHEVSVTGRLKHEGPSRRSVEEDTLPLPDKKRQDTRRRI